MAIWKAVQSSVSSTAAASLPIGRSALAMRIRPCRKPGLVMVNGVLSRNTYSSWLLPLGVVVVIVVAVVVEEEEEDAAAADEDDVASSGPVVTTSGIVGSGGSCLLGMRRCSGDLTGCGCGGGGGGMGDGANFGSAGLDGACDSSWATITMMGRRVPSSSASSPPALLVIDESDCDGGGNDVCSAGPAVPVCCPPWCSSSPLPFFAWSCGRC